MNNTWNTALSPEERLRILLRQMRMDEQSKQINDSFPTLQHSEIRKYRPHGTDRTGASPLFPPLIGTSSDLNIDTIAPQPALCRVNGGANCRRRPAP